jgi:hypothetical protein
MTGTLHHTVTGAGEPVLLSFSECLLYLNTDLRKVRLDGLPLKHPPALPSAITTACFWLLVSGHWLVYRHRRLPWIPIEYWPKVLRYHGGKVIMVLRSVMPTVLPFNYNSLQLHVSGADATMLGI